MRKLRSGEPVGKIESALRLVCIDDAERLREVHRLPHIPAGPIPSYRHALRIDTTEKR